MECRTGMLAHALTKSGPSSQVLLACLHAEVCGVLLRDVHTYAVCSYIPCHAALSGVVGQDLARKACLLQAGCFSATGCPC
eukprot:871048-Pelagomonas_calceolata.AAC.2